MKSKTKKRLEYPMCSCGRAMIWSFALSWCEWVCIPCATGIPMFNGNPKVYRNKYYMNRQKKMAEKDLSVVARRYGGATCEVCDDNSCEWCLRENDPNYKFEFWGRSKLNQLKGEK